MVSRRYFRDGLQAAALKLLPSCEHMFDFGFTLTERDPNRPWIVLGREHQTVNLDAGTSFLIGRTNAGPSRAGQSTLIHGSSRPTRSTRASVDGRKPAPSRGVGQRGPGQWSAPRPGPPTTPIGRRGVELEQRPKTGR